MSSRTKVPNNSLPTINQTELVAQSKLFRIEQLDLTFSNGANRIYERMAGTGRGAVMVVPLISEHEFLLVQEYCAGNHTYQLGFPKGLIDPGETPEQAANRELMEEIGFGAKQLIPLKTLATAPSYFNAQMHIFIARDLYPETLPGDEPEPLTVIKWPWQQKEQLLARQDFSEARSVAALFMAYTTLCDENA